MAGRSGSTRRRREGRDRGPATPSDDLAAGPLGPGLGAASSSSGPLWAGASSHGLSAPTVQALAAVNGRALTIAPVAASESNGEAILANSGVDGQAVRDNAEVGLEASADPAVINAVGQACAKAVRGLSGVAATGAVAALETREGTGPSERTAPHVAQCNLLTVPPPGPRCPQLRLEQASRSRGACMCQARSPGRSDRLTARRTTALTGRQRARSGATRLKRRSPGSPSTMRATAGTGGTRNVAAPASRSHPAVASSQRSTGCPRLQRTTRSGSGRRGLRIPRPIRRRQDGHHVSPARLAEAAFRTDRWHTSGVSRPSVVKM
jgi:hypothetical protein